MNTKWMWLILGIAVGALGVSLATGQIDLAAIAGKKINQENSNAASNVAQPPTVTVVKPISRQFVETLRVNGSIVAREEVLIAPQIEGQRIRTLLAETGDTVKKGQLLARLVIENFDALVAQNDATLQRAEAGIAQARSSIIQAKARLTESAAALKRAKSLSKSGYTSQSILEQRQAGATSARADLAKANDSLKLAISEKAQAEAQRRELLWRRSHTEIKAAVDGFILSRSAKVGGIATALGEPMFRIVKAGEVEFDGEVTSDQLHRLKSGQTVELVAAGIGNVRGTVRMVSPHVAKDTRLGQVRVFIGVNRNLRVGTFATGIIKTTRSHGLAIPSSAIMRDADGPYVLIVDVGKAKIQRVTTGLISDGYIEIRNGLSENDRVVTKAGTFLGPGELIKPIETPQPTNQRQADVSKAG